MPRPWTESFDFYLATVEDQPLSILLDLSAAEHGPLLTHSKRVLVRVPVAEAGEDGLPTAEAAEHLGDLEDALVKAYDAIGGIYVGRTLGTSLAMFFFYVPNAVTDESLPALPKEAAGAAVRTARDPEWADYFEFLFPDTKALHSILNRRLVRLLEEHGDTLSEARDLDHEATFAEHNGAAAAGVALTGLNYDVESPTLADGEQRWTLYFRRSDSLDEGRIDEVVSEILDVVTKHHGEYEGWSCDVIDHLTADETGEVTRDEPTTQEAAAEAGIAAEAGAVAEEGDPGADEGGPREEGDS